MTNKERLEDLLIEFDELDMQPMIMVPDPLDRAKRWEHELTYAINHLKAEVAMEIFEEIEKAIYHTAFNVPESVIRFRNKIAELKKKYTEGEK